MAFVLGVTILGRYFAFVLVFFRSRKILYMATIGIRNSFLILVTLAFLLHLSGVASADQSDSSREIVGVDPLLRDRLFTEAIQAWNRNKKRNETVLIDARTHTKSTKSEVVVDWRMKVNGNRILVERRKTNIGPDKPVPALTDDRSQAMVVDGMNGDYSYRIQRAPTGGTWGIKSVRTLQGVPLSTDIELVATFNAYNMFRQLNTDVLLVPLDELIRSPDFTLISLGAVREHERDLVKLTFSYKPAQKVPIGAIIVTPMRAGSLVLDPEYDWGPRSYELATKDAAGEGTFTVSIDYVPKNDSVQHSIVQRFSSRQVNGDKSVAMVTIDFVKVEYPVISDEEFRLTAYDLPEPGNSLGSQRTVGFIFINVAVLLMITVVFFYRKYKGGESK